VLWCANGYQLITEAAFDSRHPAAQFTEHLVKPDRDKWRKERNTIINSDPCLMSLIYDLDLLPEQVDKESRQEWMLDTTVAHWTKRVTADSAEHQNTPPTPHE
jgi:hypothetical protein